MLGRLFPRQFDNNYQGYGLALWLFAPLLFVKIAIGVNSAGLNPWISARQILEGPDGVPVGSYGAAGETVVLLFSMLGFALLLLSLIGLVALVRYRAMVPLMYLVLLADQVGRKVINLTHPIERTGASNGVTINLVLLVALIVGLALSMATPAHKLGSAKSAI